MVCKKCKKEIAENSIFCNWCGSKQVKTPRKTIRRENGTGTVCKRSDLKKTPYMALTPATKNSGREVIGYYTTAQQAKDALDEYRKNPTEKLNITVKELYEEWKPLGYKGKSKQLQDCYNAAWNKLSDIYDIKFRELRTAQMQNIIEYLQTERIEKDKKGNDITLKPMSYSSLSKIKILLGLLYKYAMQNDIVNKNYAEYIVLPKNKKEVKDCFTDLELKKIENSIETVPFADCILFMCYTGLRITEFLQLTKMSVRNTDGVCSLVGGVKTEAGKDRIVPVHSKIQPILDAWLAKNGETIFCRPDGTAYTTNNFREYCYMPALKKIGIRELTPHATRRTFATRMSAAGVREEDMIALMGHTNIQVGVDHYIKQSVGTLKDSIEKIS